MDLRVPVAAQRARAPEADLRDAGQRPLGVDVDHVAVDHGHVAPQVELDTVHPVDVACERPDRLEAGVGAEQAGGEQRRDALDGQRADVVIALDDLHVSVALHQHAGDAIAHTADLLHLRVPQIADAQRLEAAQPGLDPDVVGGAVQHAVRGFGRGIEDGEGELDEDVADGARARLVGLGRDQRAGDPGGEELPVGRGA